VEIDGSHKELLALYENEDPAEVVQRFGAEFNLTENAMERLLE